MNKNVIQAIKFTLFSLSAGIIQAGSFAIFRAIFGEEAYWLNHLLSLALSVIWNFTFNRKYTFKPTGHVVRDMLLVALFYAVFTPASTWLGNWLESIGCHDWLVQLIVMCSNLVTEYFFQKYVVYKEKAE
jgi:putative flippase GtrA